MPSCSMAATGSVPTRRCGRRRAPRRALAGDLSVIAETRTLAEAANRSGRFDAVIHNAGIGYREPQRGQHHRRVAAAVRHQTLAPYILTALIERPQRLVYLSSGLHRSADSGLDDVTWERRRWNGTAAYSETKLHDVLIAFAVARRWPEVFSNALEPGWVATKMAAPGRPTISTRRTGTQAWLAVSDEPAARVSGRYFYHLQQRATNPLAHDVGVQDRLLDACARLSGVALP